MMHNEVERSGPLDGLRVLDLTIAMAGPMCTQRLGEMGADIVKIEAPGGGDFARHAIMAGVTKFGDAICYVTLNRNKRSLVLDLKSEAGRKVLYGLVKDADVLVQNYRPRVAAKLGIDYASLSAINPRLVYGSITGYGDEGPMKERPGQDLLLQAFTGLTFNGGVRDGLPQASPLYMVDVTASHLLGEGLLAALVARGVTGRGQEVKVSMMAAITEMQCQEVTSFLAAEAPPQRGAAPQVSIYQEPPYGIHACRQGFLAIAQADLDVLAKALELPELADLKAARPSQDDAAALTEWRDRVVIMVANRLAEETAEHWDGLLAPLGVWCIVVNDYAAFLAHPQAKALLTEMEHPKGGRYTTVAPAIRFSGQSAPALTSAPAYGADSRAILEAEGFAASEIDALIAQGAVVAA
ncbi:CaiB/BaiF CoA transferase family protein [Afifella pfennigii]|uniref:CaiB/BaiF CoA transferase family protein n=1 Tax=Afifella pfennigii TaxID=209897 RepID=UPI00047C7FC8|nr:CaiB/BaiF CoA-transferase family protein [Afifella pfennigii]